MTIENLDRSRLCYSRLLLCRRFTARVSKYEHMRLMNRLLFSVTHCETHFLETRLLKIWIGIGSAQVSTRRWLRCVRSIARVSKYKYMWLMSSSFSLSLLDALFYIEEVCCDNLCRRHASFLALALQCVVLMLFS